MMLKCLDVAAILPGANNWQKRVLEEIKYIVIHHSAAARDSSPQEIANYHVTSLGWPGIGYTYVVSQTGQIYRTGDLTEVRYNVAGRNRECVGVCLPGDWTAQQPPLAQIAGAVKVVGYLKARLPWARVVGHRDIALPEYATSCPGDTWPDWAVEVQG